jgi:G6PDH family F420-dependent oxidoreductase
VTTFGYALCSEEFTPQELLWQAARAERAGFEALWISDHYHPWNKEQGEAAFVWAVIGALAVTTRLPVTSAVTCPTIRLHPAIVAQAAATAQVMHEGRFSLGVGSGEALNEQILGDHWPSAEVRLEMLEEAVEVMRALWGGETLEHYGVHYVVQNAHVYTRHETPPPVIVSGFAPKAIDLAARIGDGYCNTAPDGEAVSAFRQGGGGDKPCHGSIKVCWGEDEAAARATAHRLWPNAALPGELSQILPTPPHFSQAAELVTEDMVAEIFPCGPDIDLHVEMIQKYVDAGYDEVYIQQIGPEQEAFFDVYEREVLPRLR